MSRPPRPGRAARFHLVIGLITVILLPAASWLSGSRQLAWTMFNLTDSYRLSIFSIDSDGNRHELAPTELAAAVTGPVTRHLAGADGWRYHNVGRVTMGRHLEDVALLACRVAAKKQPRAPIAVEIKLDERRDLDDRVSSRALRVACGAGG